MAFSGDPAMRRSDLLEVVSVLDVDAVLERAVRIAVERSGARATVLARSDDGWSDGEPAAAPDDVRQRPLHLAGIGRDDAVALRGRLGTDGLAGSPGARLEQDVVRLRDPRPGADPGGAELLRVPVVVEGELYADLLLLDPPGGAFADDAVESIAVIGRVAGVAVRNALSYTLNERRRQSLELSAAVDLSVAAPFRLTEPLARIAEGALRLAGARSAAVVSAVSHGVDVSAAAGVVDDDLARTIDRVTDHLRSAQVDGVSFSVDLDDVRVWGLPLRADHAFAGVVLLVDEVDARRPSAVDEELVASFVRHGSLVLDHTTLQQERQHAVLAADRDRIARDLHDVVIQRLYATALRLRAVTRPTEDDEHVTEAIREIGDSIRDIRGTVFELERGRSGSLRSDALALAREYETALGFVPVVRSFGPVDALVDGDLAHQATVVLRELLSNCARHAGAGRCEVDLAVESGWFTLDVSDDGRGLPADDRPRSGLRNLAARAADLGGELVVLPGEPRGTRLRWRVPLGQAAEVGDAPGAPG